MIGGNREQEGKNLLQGAKYMRAWDVEEQDLMLVYTKYRMESEGGGR